VKVINDLVIPTHGIFSQTLRNALHTSIEEPANTGYSTASDDQLTSIGTPTEPTEVESNEEMLNTDPTIDFQATLEASECPSDESNILTAESVSIVTLNTPQ